MIRPPPAGRARLLIGCLAAVAVLALAGREYQAPQVRVKLGALDHKMTVTAPGLKWQAGIHSGGGPVITLAREGGRVLIDQRRVPPPVTITGQGPIEVDGLAFRGRLVVSEGEWPLLINLVDVESYVAGVINHEIDSRWPEAAVDAQAILARTYALLKARERKERDFDLDRTVSDQVYGGVAAEDELCWASVKRTRGRVLSYDGALAVGLYHSCCGGRTELPSEVWGGSNLAYQKSVACPYCQDAPRYFWRFPETGAVTGTELSSLLGLRDEVMEVAVQGRDLSGRVTRLRITAGTEAHYLTGQEFRQRLGYENIFSTALAPELEPGGFVFRGSGSGHGVGMCQWGARGMALAGFRAEAILGYYFPGTRVIIWSGSGLK